MHLLTLIARLLLLVVVILLLVVIPHPLMPRGTPSSSYQVLN